MKKITLFILCVMTLVFTGCGTIQLVDDAEEILLQVGITAAAKALGQNMVERGEFTWGQAEESYLAFIQENGMSLDTVAVVKAYLEPRVPELYKSEYSQAIQLIDSGVTTSKDETMKRWEAAIMGFRAGAVFAQSR